MAYNTYRDKEKLAIYLRKKNFRVRIRRRIRVLEKLGGRCVVCNIEDISVLQIDHIIPLNTGTRRLTLTQLFPKILRDEYDTTTLQILCANCHMRKTTNERKKDYEF